MGGKYNPLTQICNQMIVPCYQLVHMVITGDATNHFGVNTFRPISIEYNIILSRILQNSQIYTNWDDNRLT
jgi:hypothetical protein